MSLQSTRPASAAEWREVADRCPYATFFHRPEWVGVFARTYPHMRDASVRITLGGGPPVILPLLQQRTFGGLGAVHLSTPAGCYGGWICAAPLAAPEADALARWILAHHRNLALRVNPFDEQSRAWAACPGEEDATEVLDLRAFADEEALRAHYKHSVRKQINKGMRAGFQARPARSWAEWEAYLAIYQGALRRWGQQATSVYPADLFRNLCDLDDACRTLWLVLRDEVIIGGNLNFYHGRHCVEWHAAYDSAHFKDGSRNFLVHQIILDAHARGYVWYDFNPSGGHAGARAFKQTFGTTALDAKLIVRRDPLHRLRGAPVLRRLAAALRR